MERLRIDDRGGVRVIYLDRPGKLNAIDRLMWRELYEAFRGLDGFTGVVLTGRGRAFSAGDDIKEMYGFRDYRDALDFFSEAYRAIRALLEFDGVVIVALNGLAAGGGAELTLLADYVIAYRDVYLWFPEARLGLFPPILSTIGVDILGLRNVKRLSIYMPKIYVDEACRMGLIDEVIDRGIDIVEYSIERLASLTEAPTQSIGWVKRIIYERHMDELYKALDRLARLSVSSIARERMKQFIDKT